MMYENANGMMGGGIQRATQYNGGLTGGLESPVRETVGNQLQSRTEALAQLVLEVCKMTADIESRLLGPVPCGTGGQERGPSPSGLMGGTVARLEATYSALNEARASLLRISGEI